MCDEGGLPDGKHTHLNTSTTHTHTPPMKLTTIKEMMMKNKLLKSEGKHNRN